MSSSKKSTGIPSDVSLDTSTSTTGPHYYDKSQDLSSDDVKVKHHTDVLYAFQITIVDIT